MFVPLLVEVVRLFAAASAVALLDRVGDHFPRFAGDLLNSANQFFLLAFGVTKIIIRELGPFLFQLALGDVPVAFDFECVHVSLLFCSCCPPIWRESSVIQLRAMLLHIV